MSDGSSQECFSTASDFVVPFLPLQVQIVFGGGGLLGRFGEVDIGLMTFVILAVVTSRD